MTRDIVLAGGGHTHLVVLLNGESFLRNGHRMKLISPTPYLYYSGMGPGLLGGKYPPYQSRFHIKKMVEDRGITFIEDSVAGINTNGRRLLLASGKEVSYDLLSLDLGSEVPVEGITVPDEHIITAKPIVNLCRAKGQLLEAMEEDHLKLAVIGGGPAGVEIAGNLWRLVRRSRHGAEITLYCGKLLPDMPEKVRHLAFSSLGNRKIRVVEGVRAQSIRNGRLVLSDWSDILYDFAFVAIGIHPPLLFSQSGLATGRDGGMLVNRYLQSVDHPEIFGGGDCISWQEHPLPKVGVYALRQGPVLLHNLHAFLNGTPPIPFEPGKPYFLIMDMGDGRGIAWKNGSVWDGRLPLWIKEYIDRRFMKSYQVSGETAERNEACL